MFAFVVYVNSPVMLSECNQGLITGDVDLGEDADVALVFSLVKVGGFCSDIVGDNYPVTSDAC